MPNLDQLVEKFKQKILIDQKTEKFKTEVLNPLADTIFNINFIEIFSNITNEINNKLGFKVITFQPEGKNRFVIEGQHHRIYFQKSKIEFSSNEIANIRIIPICIWKGVTKHLKPISYSINTKSKEIKWNIPFNSVEEYSKILFSKLIEDEDFTI